MVSWILILNSEIRTTYGDNVIQSSRSGNSLEELEDMKVDQHFLEYLSYSQVWLSISMAPLFMATLLRFKFLSPVFKITDSTCP